MPSNPRNLLWLVHHPALVLRGIRDSAANRDLRGLLETLLLFICESLNGIKTQGYTAASECSDSTGYQPTHYHILPSLLRYVNSDDTFVDLGCGKGRVLWFVATRRKLRKAIGVEIEPELAQIARENMKKAGLRTPVTIIEGDASQVDLSECTVYFLYNPFGERTLRAVLENIRRSLRARPRSIQIIHVNPKSAQILDDEVWLRGEEYKGYLRVWKNQR